MKVPFFQPWITEQDKKAVTSVLNNRWLTNGPYLKKFEQKISSFINSKHSLGVSSATHALHLCLASLNIHKGDEVIVPTLTFAATADVVTYCGGTPILADVDYNTFNILPIEIEKKISEKTKAVIVVHYGGQSCDMDRIIFLAKKYNFKIIEDCAHALGSTYKKSMCGDIGSAGCFSFYPTKIITTGEGGMITTSDDSIYNSCKTLRTHGMTKTPVDREKDSTWKYDISQLGFNYRLDEIRASLGNSQFNRIHKINSRRINIAKKYNRLIGEIEGLSIPKVSPDRNHIYHLYTIKIEEQYELTRDELFRKLSKKGIGTSVQYFPLHLMSYNANRFKSKHFPNANTLKDNILSLPIFPTMTDQQIDYVVSCLR